LIQIINKQNLLAWLDEMATHHPLIAPISDNDNYVFAEVSSSKEIAFDYDKTKKSLKEFLLKPEEVLMTASLTEGKAKPAPMDETMKILFGARPCDITALELFDQVFSEDYNDPYYFSHRKNTVILGLNCLNLCKDGFCGITNSFTPKKGYDIMFTELLGEKYLVESGSLTGEKLIQQSMKTEELKEGDKSLILQTFKSINWNLSNNKSLVGINSIIAIDHQALWEEYGEKCLACNLCTSVCPTCWCFTVHERIAVTADDLSDLSKTEKYRHWTSCLFKDYHTVSGGHVFNPTTASRLEFYYKHKFKGIPEKFGVLGCVGCGRCVSACPVGIDIRESIERITN
jgi:ferredoxin